LKGFVEKGSEVILLVYGRKRLLQLYQAFVKRYEHNDIDFRFSIHCIHDTNYQTARSQFHHSAIDASGLIDLPKYMHVLSGYLCRKLSYLLQKHATDDEKYSGYEFAFSFRWNYINGYSSHTNVASLASHVSGIRTDYSMGILRYGNLSLYNQT